MSSGGQPVDCHRRSCIGSRNSGGGTTDLEAYVRRAEEELLSGRFAAAFATYRRGIVGFVIPVRPDAAAAIDAAYADQLARDGNSLRALKGASFGRWAFSDYAGAIELLDVVLSIEPQDVYGTLFRGSSRALQGTDVEAGLRDLEDALELAPDSPDVRYVIADAYAYGARPDLRRAFGEASLALDAGLDTPRVHAILAAAALATGDGASAGAHFARHLELVTTEVRASEPLVTGGSLALPVVPGRVWEVPLPLRSGATISVGTSSDAITDSIAVLLDPEGRPVTGGDDEAGAFAVVRHVAASDGTYGLRVASFEAVETGTLVVTRD